MFGIDDAIMGGIISGGLSFLGGERRNSSQAAQAEQANAFSAQQFATRYQTTVKDMEAAGLNPMLAYSQGGGTPPSGQQAQMQDTVTPAVQSFSQARQVGQIAKMNSAQIANTEADTANKRAQADLIQAQIAQTYASAGQSNAMVGQIEANVKKITAELANIPLEGERLKRLANLLFQQTNLADQQQLTEAQRYEQVKATVRKLASETSLLDLDIDAAKSLDNLGRTSKELKPIVDILRVFLRK